VASFSHSVEIPRPPAEVFPWLLAEDKVPRWTGHLERYERLDGGPLGQGSKVRQVLDVSGRTIDVTLEITTYQPPSGAQTRFSTNGIDVVTAYRLAVGADTSAVAESEKIPTAAGREVYLTYCWLEVLCTAEIRVLGWLYRELYGRQFQP
jgi:hypothetical protein